MLANKRTYSGNGVYIGRPGKWGNPFSHQDGTAAKYKVSSRDEAVDAHKRWLWDEIKAGRVSLEDLAALNGKTLVCWCHPLRCHGENLELAAAWAVNELKNGGAR